MQNSNKSLLTDVNAALISIHPEYAEKILAGEKCLEYRRTWAATSIDVLVIYATTPVQRIVGLAKISTVFHGSKTKLWELGRQHGGGISRRKLFACLDGRKEAVAISIEKSHRFNEALDPRMAFNKKFRPPQSFRYLKPAQIKQINRLTKGKSWE